MPTRRRSWLVAPAVLWLTACSAPSTSVAPDQSTPTVRPSAAASSPAAGDLQSTPPSVAESGSVAAEPPPLALEVVAEGLDSPISVSSAPGGWLLVNEQPGRVVAVQSESGQRADTLDLTDRIAGGGERGLLGLALHPDWPDEARAFVHYSDLDGNTVLAEFSGTQDGAEAPIIDPASEQVLLGVEQPFPNHNGGQLAFGPDGYLWMALGDGGSGGDPMGHGQDSASLLGSILRLDVSTPGEYAIPDDNPFANGGGAGENYLVGLRNPWRFSFDHEAGTIWIADVGQNAYEEVNRLDLATAAGANLGWSRMEATHCFESSDCSADGLTLPLVEYEHDLGCSITGGHVYRGEQVSGLAGWYVFGDYCSGLLFGVPSDAEVPSDGTALAPRVLLEADIAIGSFGLSGDRELFVTGIDQGALYRIVGGE